MTEQCNHIWNAHRQCQWCHRDQKDVDYEDGKRQLERLFSIVAPQCNPLDSLTGLVSQIDNYIAGLRDENYNKDRIIESAGKCQWQKQSTTPGIYVCWPGLHGSREYLCAVYLDADDIASGAPFVAELCYGPIDRPGE